MSSASPSTRALAGEFLVVFVALPLAFRFKTFPFPPIPALWLLAAYCLFRLLSDPSFDRRAFWKREALRRYLPQIVATFVLAAGLIGFAIYRLRPWLLFEFVRRAPIFWAILMVLYPVLSVYPQGIVYRTFFFERYRRLFPNPWLQIAMSAVTFSFAHIIFRNPVAVILTLIGGVLFAWRYRESRSLFTSSFEHALYGCLMFTVGLGDYFYKGAR